MTADDPSAGFPIFPVGLRLGGRRVVVVGGGPVAERRVRGLLVAGADVLVVSSSVTPGLRELMDNGRLTWTQRRYAAGDLATAWYAVAATASPEVNAAIRAEADQRRIFCVRADDATRASAWTLAAGTYGDLTVAVFVVAIPGEQPAYVMPSWRHWPTAPSPTCRTAPHNHERRPVDVVLRPARSDAPYLAFRPCSGGQTRPTSPRTAVTG